MTDAADHACLHDDLERLPSGSWTVAKYEAFVANPDAEIRRLCAANELAWDSILPQELPLSSYTVSTPDPTKWQRYAAEIDAVIYEIAPLLFAAKSWLYHSALPEPCAFLNDLVSGSFTFVDNRH